MLKPPCVCWMFGQLFKMLLYEEIACQDCVSVTTLLGTRQENVLSAVCLR